jgi:tetratricopeptide (TPR) repeat protein
MRTLPYASSPEGDWSFKIGLGLVLLFAAAEICSVGYFYVAKPRFAPGKKVATTTTAATTTEAAPPARARMTPAASLAPIAAPSVGLAVPSAAPSAPPAAVHGPAPVVATTPVLTQAQSPPASAVPSAAPAKSPAVAAAPTPSAQSIGERLLKEANLLQRKGDTNNALVKLQEATQRDPRNAEAFAEMATIYETIRMYDRSNETWQKVQDMGPSAGPVYELAMLKLNKGAEATPAPPAPVAVVEASAAPFATTSPSRDIPDGSTFGIAEVTVTETPDADAETNLALRIGVRKKPSTVVDHTKVKIQVFFYDTVDDKDIKLTDADVNYEWITPNHDWAQSNPEVLAVTYLRAKNKALSQEAALSAVAGSIQPGRKIKAPKAPDVEAGRRKYLGYIVRVYYNDKLQAQRAEPTKLLTLFPSPSTAPTP